MALLLLLTVDPCARPTEHGSWPSSDRDSTAPGPARLTPCLTSETAVNRRSEERVLRQLAPESDMFTPWEATQYAKVKYGLSCQGIPV